MVKRTLVLGASANPSRYSYLALKRLQATGHPVVALGAKRGKVGDLEIENQPGDWQPIDTVTIYLGKANQSDYYKYLTDLMPKRVIFNPGAENEELEYILNSKGIKTIEACTLVLLATGQY